MRNYFILAAVLLLFGCNRHKNPFIIIKTNFGNIEAELFPGNAPESVAAFLSYVDSGLYKNSSFYRLTILESMTPEENTGVIQGGIWQSNNAKAASLPGIPHESPKQTGLSHTDGTLSLARTAPGTANSEFFICIGDQTEYDSSRSINPDGLGYAAFGRVTSGMEIVKKIQNQPANGQQFTPQVAILNIERL